MEQIFAKTALKCSKHNNKQPFFVKTNNLDSNQVFYCQVCINRDQNIQLQDFNLIEEIIESSDKTVIFKWPHFDDIQINQQIEKAINDQQFSIEDQILKFFDNMKEEINKKVDNLKKKFIKDQNVQIVNEKYEIILKKYQEISKIQEFKILLTDKNTDSLQKEQQCLEFINKFNEQKSQNSKILKDVIDDYNYFKEKVNITKLNSIKNSILFQIDQLNCFNQSLNEIENKESFRRQGEFNQKLEDTFTYPPFDYQFIKYLKEIDLLPSMQLIQSTYMANQAKDIKLNTILNNYICIYSPKQYNVGSFYSNFILDSYKKYIFRFQFNKKYIMKAAFSIGLVKDSYKNNENCDNQNLSCLFLFEDQKKGHKKKDGIDKIIKGDLSDTKNVNCIELRVCINDQVLEILDYPYYTCKLSLEDCYLKLLDSNQQFRLQLYIEQEITLVLKKAAICDQFCN